MGIDYYNCAYCERAFPDCSRGFRSCEMCSSFFCSPECASLKEIEVDEAGEESDENNYEEEYNCCICRKEDANNSILLECLLRHYKISRDDALKIWREEDDLDVGE